MKKYKQIFRSAGLGLAVLFGMIVYAYGFQVTRVNLDETRSERRQQQLVRILRALARPDFLEYERVEVQVNAPFMVPCPEGGFTPPEPDTSKPYMIIEPACANPGDTVIVRGYNFESNSRGPLSFIPPSEVSLPLGILETDGRGFFELEVKVPRRDEDVVQTIRGVTRENVGAPYLTKTAYDTWDKIVETVFLALLATTLGTLFAVPVSFFAAKNLMRDVKTPLISIALNILLIPLGFIAGGYLAQWGRQITEVISVSVLADLAGVIIGPAIFLLIFRWALPQGEITKPAIGLRIARIVGLAVAALVMILSLLMLSGLAIKTGNIIRPALGGWGFIGKFITDLGDILGMAVVVISAMGGAGVLSSIGSKVGKEIAYKISRTPAKILSLILSTAAGALLAILIMAGINWFYQYNDPVITLYWPGAIGGLLGFLLAIRLSPNDDLPIGIVIYYASRTLWNGLRSIEALVWVIVFVVWVGIGPFAGVLALSLHTIAALAKLYSEQVESILPGPLEAITATGANRLQTIVYAVVPQIIPPYISFTMYRWDINVRMSTIIGFAGGGGIGFLLYQNINLLNYRAASAQMLAIAVVVASMDYISSKLREKVV